MRQPPNRFSLDRTTLALAAIMLLALALRLYDLTGESLWLDEGGSLRIAALPLTEIPAGSAASWHPPLYFFILHYWMALFGNSEWAVRLPAALFGLGAVPLIYLLGRRLYDRPTGLVAALLLALSVVNVQYSQEVRGYSLAVVLTLLSFYFLLRLGEGRPSLKVGYVVSTLGLLYTHNSGLFVLLAQVAYVLLGRRGLRQSLPWLLAPLVLYVPWVWFSSRVEHNGVTERIPTGPLSYLLHALKDLSGSPALFWALAAVLLGGAACHYLRRREDSKSPAAQGGLMLLLLWLAVPLLGLGLFSMQDLMPYMKRYLLVATPALYLLAARATTTLRPAAVRPAAIGLMMLLSLASLNRYYAGTGKEQWREAAAYLDASARPGDLLLFDAGYCQNVVFRYYSRRPDLTGLPVSCHPGPVEEADVRGLWPALSRHQRVWVIRSHSHDRSGLLRRALTTGYAELERRRFVKVEVCLYMRGPASPQASRLTAP
jgi:mannosyltransferase